MNENTKKRLSPFIGWMVFFGCMAAVFVIGIITAQLLERKLEVGKMTMVLKPLDPMEPDNEKYKDNYPREYDSWKRTEESEGATKYGGPTQFSHLEKDPNNKKLFAGYAFSVEYNDDRGHANALKDVTESLRHKRNHPNKDKGKDFPGTCWTCKSPDVPVLMKQMGLTNFYASKFWDLEDKITHSIGCADCHDGETMNLRISRPALREAFAAQGKDIDKVSHQEMRTLVCAQCHVEYYFKGSKNYLTFPWKNGINIDEIEKYYEEENFTDWVHPVSKTRMVKMQHPDYEIFSAGIHAARGVACADCHMPYISEGGVKFSDHHVQSPLKNFDNSCAVCHRWSKEEAVARVEKIQDRNFELLKLAGNALVLAHDEVGAAMKEGLNDKELEPVRSLIRKGQMRWDFIAASNSMGFHAPQECARVLAGATDLAQQARVELAKARIARLQKKPAKKI